MMTQQSAPSPQMMQMQNAMVQMLNDLELIQNQASSAAGDNRQQQQTEALIAQTLEEIESATRSVTQEYVHASQYLAKANIGEALHKYVSGTHQSQANQALQQIARLNADTMTAKRVATINQQNTIHSNVVSGYMQLTIICLCVAVVVMFPFAFEAVRDVFRHPFVVMQVLLMLIAVAYIVVVVLRLWANRNHYWMLYQERVFQTPKKLPSDGKECKCPPTHPDTHAHVDVSPAQVTCGQ